MSESEKEDLFGDEERELGVASSDEDAMEVERQPVHRRALLRRYPPSHGVSKAYLSRVPAFLRVDPQPFDAAKFVATAKTEEELALEANAVRWKYARDASAQSVTRVSNTRVVEWSDGSRTLQLGSEHFTIRTHGQSDAAFVCTQQQDDDALLATRYVVSDTMSFLPTSTTSSTHRMLARALARKQESGQLRVGSVSTTEDPDKAQRELERAVQAQEKARRKLAAQREDIVSYTYRTEPSVGRSDDEDLGDEGGHDDDEEEESAQESQVEEMDDDELEQQAERLNKIKRSQMANEDEASGGEEEVVQRRRVLDDEDSE